MSALLPERFAELTPFLDWALPSQTQRMHKRLASTMAQIQAFYDAMVPRMPEILEHLDQFPLGDLPPGEQRLLELTFSLAQVAPAVEMFHQPAVVCGFDAKAFLPTHEPTPTRPQMSVAPQSFV